jgi:hypothetical protein
MRKTNRQIIIPFEVAPKSKQILGLLNKTKEKT